MRIGGERKLDIYIYLIHIGTMRRGGGKGYLGNPAMKTYVGLGNGFNVGGEEKAF